MAAGIEISLLVAGLPRLRELGATVSSVALPAFVARAAEAPTFLQRLARAER